MTPQEIQLVRDSFHKIAPIADQAAALFYTRLFELDPALRVLFHGDMAAQGRKLMQALALCVGSLDRLAAIVPAVRELGRRHVAYHVRDEHYETVGAALLWTLEKGLGPDFTADTRAAWSKVYWVLAETMKTGARDGASQQARVA